MKLNRALAETAIGNLAKKLGLATVRAALGIAAIADGAMSLAVRAVSVNRGIDPRDATLIAFGGAGPLHACALAEELGIDAVLVPEAAGVLSALGLVASDERRDRVVSHVRPLDEVRDLPAEGEADLRYKGQSFELTVPLQPDLAAAFHRAHEERYGYADASREVELVAIRTAEITPAPDVELEPASPRAVRGPELVELPGATCWVPDGWSGETNDDGTLVLRR